MVPMRLWRAGVAGALLAVLIAPAVLATYPNPPHQLTLSTQASVTCGKAFQVVATVLDKDGNPVTEQAVQWEIAPSGSVTPQQSTTNTRGQATAYVTIPSADGPHTITATAGDGSAQVVLKACGAVLPNTSTSPGGTPGWQLAAAAAAMLVGMLLAFGQLVAIRR